MPFGNGHEDSFRVVSYILSASGLGLCGLFFCTTPRNQFSLELTFQQLLLVEDEFVFFLIPTIRLFSSSFFASAQSRQVFLLLQILLFSLIWRCLKNGSQDLPAPTFPLLPSVFTLLPLVGVFNSDNSRILGVFFFRYLVLPFQ